MKRADITDEFVLEAFAAAERAELDPLRLFHCCPEWAVEA